VARTAGGVARSWPTGGVARDSVSTGERAAVGRELSRSGHHRIPGYRAPDGAAHAMDSGALLNRDVSANMC